MTDLRLVPTWSSRLWLTLALAANRLRLEGLTARWAVRAIRAMREEVLHG